MKRLYFYITNQNVMATTKKAKVKTAIIDETLIITHFMNEVLENNEEPKNVYVFCKKHSIEESDFYSFFGSFDSLKETIWEKFFENALTTIQNDKNYASFS